MLHRLLRLCAAILAMLAIADMLLPGHTETMSVVKHSMDDDSDGPPHYFLILTDTQHVHRCEVSARNFHTVADGQHASVRRSALTGSCAAIIVDGRSLPPPLLSRFTHLCTLAVCLGIAWPLHRSRRQPPN